MTFSKVGLKKFWFNLVRKIAPLYPRKRTSEIESEILSEAITNGIFTEQFLNNLQKVQLTPALLALWVCL